MTHATSCGHDADFLSEQAQPCARFDAGEGLVCEEAEFVICCFALCPADSYDIAAGRLQIRGQA